ncbi:MAG: 3'-5' exonuclease [Bacteroidota bacterium]
MNFVVFDLEATCWQGKREGRNETIEIGAVLVNEHMQIVSEFEQFVKPVTNPILSDFCIELTSIQQSDVDSAPDFKEAINYFKEWFGYPDEDHLLCSWGFYDRKQLESDCGLHGLDTQWIEQHISLKHQYTQIAGLRRHVGMKGALYREGFDLEGTHHRGIDDARNIAKIFVKYFEEWSR